MGPAPKSKDDAKRLVVRVNTKLNEIPGLREAAAYTGVPPVMMVFLLAATLALLSGLLAPAVSYLVGCLYPAGMSFKAIRDQSLKDGHRDVEQWLTYWVVFTFVQFFETFAGFLFSWIPMFHMIKVAFLLYLTLPHFRGATAIFETFLRPFLDDHWETISSILDHVNWASDAATARVAAQGAGVID